MIEHHNNGGNNNPHLDPELRPLRLTPDGKQALRAFLESLNGGVGAAQSK